MKHKFLNKIKTLFSINPRQDGFTVIELLVVISIMVIMSGVVIIGFNRQRAVRSILLAQNETVTNIRKIQSYTLSSRNINPTTPVKFYVLQFDTGATYYTVNAVDSAYNYYPELEKIYFPDGVTISDQYVISNQELDKPGDSEAGSGFGTDQKSAGDGANTPVKCSQVAFSAPYGQMYIKGAESCDSSITTQLRDPASLLGLANKSLSFSLSNPKGGDPKIITLHGLSGRVVGE